MIRGHKRPLERAIKEEAVVRVNLHNRFDIEVIDAATGKVRQRAQAENCILNALWTRLLSPNTYFNYIHYGTGTGSPAAVDTSLFSFLGYLTPMDTVYTNDAENNYFSCRKLGQLSETAAVGDTLSEVGIAYSTTSSTLVTHAMLKDMNGNTITIHKTDTDVVNIYATVFVHYDATYSNGDVVIMPYTFENYFWKYLCGTGEAAFTNKRVIVTTGGTYRVTMTLNGSALTCLGVSDNICKAYLASVTANVAAKTLTFNVPRLAVGDSNLGGLRAFMFCWGYTSYSGGLGNTKTVPFLSVNVGPSWFPGTTITGEAIGTGDGITKDFATAFGYISSATIKVDGVEQASGVTVDMGEPLNYQNMGQYFIWLDKESSSSSGTAALSAPCPVSTGADMFDVAGTNVYYNPHYADGILSYIVGSNVAISVSDDLGTWVQISSTAGTKTVAAEYRRYKYWKAVGTGQGAWNTLIAQDLTGRNIHFDTAPEAGKAITANYTTASVAKDSNHVFDLSLSIVLGERVS